MRRLNESGGHTAEAPEVAAIAEDAPSTSFSSSGSDTYISPASGAEDSGTAGHEATTQLPPSRRSVPFVGPGALSRNMQSGHHWTIVWKVSFQTAANPTGGTE